MSTWLAVLAAGLGSYLFRAAPLLLGGATLPPSSERALRYAGTGALTALIVSGVAGRPAVVVAVAVAAAIAARGASMFRVIAGGVVVYWTVNAFA